MKKIKVLYLVGAGNSGTTVLSMALGAHNSMFSVGELGHINKFIHDTTQRCTCLDDIKTCVFWSKVEFENTDQITPKLGLKQTFLRSFQNKDLNQDESNAVIANDQLYQSIAKVAGKSIIIDASKDICRLKYLLKSSQIDVQPIYMVRDIRAYTDSYLRRTDNSIFKSFRQWLKLNITTVLGLIIYKAWDKTEHLNFQNFTHEPETTLRNLCHAANIDYDPSMLDYYKNSYHNIAGTPSRFNLRPIQPVESWRNKMTMRHKLAYIFSGAWVFNYIFGVFKGSKS